MDLEPVTLAGRHVRLEPLAARHVDALATFAFDDDMWRYSPTPLRTRAELDAYVAAALDAQRRRLALPFAIVDQATGGVVGSTRFGNVDEGNRRVEIGWTWLAPAARRTARNTEAKLLLLTHAFERLDCVRVELKTDALNAVSRAAIRRLGAVEEGILRHHMVMPSGRLRDTVYHSILRDEWPAVRERLQARLADAPAPATPTRGVAT